MIACAALLLMAVHGMAQTEKPLTDEEIAAVRAWMASHPEDGSQKKIQEGTKEDNFYAPHVHGTIRGKWEYQTEENEHRFEVRNARVSLDGNVTRHVSYKAEIDLSEEKLVQLARYLGITHDLGKETLVHQYRLMRGLPEARERLCAALPLTESFLHAGKSPHARASEAILLALGVAALARALSQLRYTSVIEIAASVENDFGDTLCDR